MESLPPECLQQIFSYMRLSVEEGPEQDSDEECELKLSTMASISKTSRHLNAFIDDSLYYTLDLTLCNRKRLRLLLRTLLDQPSKCNFVRELLISLREGYRGGIADSRPARQDQDNLLLKMYAKVKSFAFLSESLRQELWNRLQTNTSSAELTILTCLCSKVRQLILGMTTEYKHAYILTPTDWLMVPAGQMANANIIVAHPQLEDVRVEQIDKDCLFSSSNIFTYLRLPALKSLNGTQLGCSGIPEISCATRRITLYESFMNAADIKALLVACPNLGNLTIDWGCEYFPGADLDFQELGDALRQCTSRLWYLQFRFDAVVDPEKQDDGTVGDLSDLDSLSCLSISAGMMYGADYADMRSEKAVLSKQPDYLVKTLPHSLEFLDITDLHEVQHTRFVNVQIANLMTHESFASLTQVVLTRTDHEEESEGFLWLEQELAHTAWHVLVVTSASQVQMKRQPSEAIGQASTKSERNVTAD